jgi:hypothetical protein
MQLAPDGSGLYVNILKKIERWLTVAAEGIPNKVFHSSLQPGEIGTKLRRAMLDHTHTLNGQEHAPNVYRIRLHPEDMATFAGYTKGLATELEQSLTTIARQNHLRVQLPIRILLEEDAKVLQRVPEVEAHFQDASPAEPVDSTRVINVPRSQTMFQLIGISGKTSGIAFDIPPGASTVGRQADRTLVLDASDVSRVHARFDLSGSSLRVYDLDSTNGTRVNGKPVTMAEVKDHDEISFGKQAFRVAVTRSGKWRS